MINKNKSKKIRVIKNNIHYFYQIFKDLFIQNIQTIQINYEKYNIIYYLLLFL